MGADRKAFCLVTYAFVVVMAGTTLPTPLYPIYERQYGLGTGMISVIFAVYALGVIGGLVTFGPLSDAIGRRRVLLPGVVLSAASAVAFLVATGTPELFVGRILSGLSAGIFTGTATAAMVDLAPKQGQARASLLAVAANIGGLGLGTLLAGLLAQFAPVPLRLPFAVDLVLLAPAGLGAVAAPGRRPGAEPGRLRLQRLRILRSSFRPRPPGSPASPSPGSSARSPRPSWPRSWGWAATPWPAS